MSRRERLGRLGAWAGAFTLVLAACGGSPDESRDDASRAAVRAKATLVQQRTDEGTRRIDVEVGNAGRHTFVVDSVRIDWPGVSPLPATPKDTEFEPGRVIDLRTEYGAPRCASTGVSSPAAAKLAIRHVGTMTVDIDAHGQYLIRRLRQRECLLQRVHAVVAVSLGSSYLLMRQRGQDFLRTVLTLRRPDGSRGGDVVVRALLGSVLLTFGPAGRLPIVVKSGVATRRVPVVLGVARCDMHARSESKQTFLLSVYVKVPDLPVQRVIVTPDQRGQVRLLGLIDRVCR